MTKLRAKLATAVIIAVVTATALGAPADARAHHHRHHHHHTPVVTSPAATPTCAALPATATLQLNGNVVFSIQCHGLSPAEPLAIDSFLIRGNCASSSFPLIGLTADLGGNLSRSITAMGCLPGTYSIQLVGSITNAEFSITFTF